MKQTQCLNEKTSLGSLARQHRSNKHLTVKTEEKNQNSKESNVKFERVEIIPSIKGR